MASYRVVLFKSEKKHDKYRSMLNNAGFEVDFEPVLDFDFVNEEELLAELVGSNGALCDAIVATSARSFEAVERVLSKSSAETRNLIRENWKKRILFAVAEATLSASPLEFSSTYSGGTDAVELCSLISQHCPSFKEDGSAWRLLFLCSSIRRDVVPNYFSGCEGREHIRLVELKVYATKKMQIGERKVTDKEWWVFFSPSGVDAVIGSLKSINDNNIEIPSNILVAAIGNTSSDALIQSNFPVHAVASSPTAEGLLEAITSAKIEKK